MVAKCIRVSAVTPVNVPESANMQQSMLSAIQITLSKNKTTADARTVQVKENSQEVSTLNQPRHPLVSQRRAN